MVSVVTVCCGEPKKGMGWYHLTQLLADPTVIVRGVVEPWFLGGGRSTPGAKVFDTFRQETVAAHPDIQFCTSVSELKVFDKNATKRDSKGPLLCLISGRTSDAPELFKQVCEGGATHIFLEKPGAETTKDLEAMRDMAQRAGIQVAIGYNKNVSDYVQQALAEIASQGQTPTSGLKVEFEHANPFGREEMMEFIAGPGAEGMVHNMMCHELALAVTFFGLRCDTITLVTLDEKRSELVTFPGGHTDWASLAFRLTLSNGNELTFFADRCGGNFSRVHVEGSTERTSFQVPCPEHAAWMEKMRAMDAEIRGYFLLQSPDYKRLKGLLVDHVAAEKPGLPENIVNLDGATEVLRVADMLKPKVKELWRGGEPRPKVPRL